MFASSVSAVSEEPLILALIRLVVSINPKDMNQPPSSVRMESHMFRPQTSC